MSIVDDRGRVAGRINLVDAIVALVILGLIPVGYGAYLLFRNPTPKLFGVSPAKLYQGPNLRIAIDGKNLRPFMRVSFNNVQGRTFMIGSTKSAQVDLPDLGAGDYDVVLYDYMQEVDRLPKALTILPLAPVSVVQMEVGGSFKELPADVASQLKKGTQFPPAGGALAEIVSVGSPRPAAFRMRAGDVTLNVALGGQTELPATLKLNCWVASNPDGTVRCMMSGPQQPAVVAPDSTLTLAGPQGWVTFQISEVHLAAAPAVAQALVRFIATPEVLGKMTPGDVDTSPKAFGGAHAATIVTLGSARPLATGAGGTRLLLGPARIVTATLRVPVERAASGWIYKEQPLKSGAPFTFETPQYVAQGEVGDVTLPSSSARKEPRIK